MFESSSTTWIQKFFRLTNRERLICSFVNQTSQVQSTESQLPKDLVLVRLSFSRTYLWSTTTFQFVLVTVLQCTADAIWRHHVDETSGFPLLHYSLFAWATMPVIRPMNRGVQLTQRWRKCTTSTCKTMLNVWMAQGRDLLWLIIEIILQCASVLWIISVKQSSCMCPRVKILLVQEADCYLVLENLVN